MQSYIYYIIGILLIGGIGYYYFSPTPVENPAGGNSANLETINSYSTTTDNVSTTTQINSTTTNKNMETNTQQSYKIKMETNKGNIVLELNPKIAPKTVENFLKLANSGFYNGVKFHRVIKDFMIQAGDPLSKDDKNVNAWGTGGPGYKFDDEIFDAATYKTGYKRGILAMANAGPNTNGSQFFIMHKDVPLPPSYTIFGKVLSGIEVVDAIANVQTGVNDRPITAVVISKVSVEK